MRRRYGGGLRKVLIAAAAALLVAAMAGPAWAGQAPAARVEVRGGDILQPGQFIKNNFRFVPRNIAVDSGDVVRWVDRDRSADAPHTVTIARQSDLPQNIAQLDACYAPGALCTETIEAHDPGSDFAPPFNFRVNRGGPGLNARGDSLLFAGPFNQAIQGQVTAPAGNTLYYLCVIHLDPHDRQSILVAKDRSAMASATRLARESVVSQ